MFRIRSIIALIILGFAIFIIGGGAGMVYQSQKNEIPKTDFNIDDAKKCNLLVEDLDSEVITSIVAYGQVVDINSNQVIISYQGNSVEIKLDQNITVYSFGKDNNGNHIQDKIDIKEIKKGDNLNVILKIMPNKELSAQTIFLLLSDFNT
jgi:hypothetical protein